MKYVPLIGPVWWLIKYKGAALDEIAPGVEDKMWSEGLKVIWASVGTVIIIALALVFLVRYSLA